MTAAWEANTRIRINENVPAIQQWAAAVAAAMTAGNVPAPFGMAWLAIESGGNPCAVGEACATGPDGLPREIGLFQTYNPDDFAAMNLNPHDYVAACVVPAIGAKQRPYEGGYQDGTKPNPQRLTAGSWGQAVALLGSTAAAKHAELGASLANYKRRQAEHYLTAWSVPWATTSPDFWCAVKSYHAWPVIINTGIAQVTKHLDRAPASWREFRSTYEIVQPLAKFNAVLQEQTAYFRGLDNAEWVGMHVVAPAPAVA